MVKGTFLGINGGGSCLCSSGKILNNGVCNSTIDMAGGVMVLARVLPSEENDFAQVLLPVALSYETFLCKLCVALRVPRDTVKKVVRLPDVLIRSTEDVCRLEPHDKLEVRIKRRSPLVTGIQKMVNCLKSYGNILAFSVGFLMLMWILINQNIIISTQHHIEVNKEKNHELHDIVKELTLQIKQAMQQIAVTSKMIELMHVAFSKCDLEEVDVIEERKDSKSNSNNNHRTATRRKT